MTPELVEAVKRAIGNHAHRWDLVACQDAAARAVIPIIESALLREIYDLPDWKDGKLDVFYFRKLARERGLLEGE